MIRRYETPTTIAELRKIDKNGDDFYYEETVVGIQLREDGVLQFDLRNMRPIRINDREALVIEIDINEVFAAIAEQIRDKVKNP